MPADRKEDVFVDFIKVNTYDVFGEDFTWRDSLPENVNADLIGEDPCRNTILVEVKYWYSDDSNRKTQEFTAVGQIIHYAHNYEKNYDFKNLRLFIVGTHKSEVVESCCEYLRAHGFSIEHRFLTDQMRRRLKKQ